MICDRKRFMTPFSLAKRTRKSMQVDASLQNQDLYKGLAMISIAKRTCWLASSRNSHKVVNFTHIQMAYDQLIVSTCVGWPNGEKLASTCERRIWARTAKSTQGISQWGGGGIIAQVNARGWSNETQAGCKSETCIDFRWAWALRPIEASKQETLQVWFKISSPISPLSPFLQVEGLRSLATNCFVHCTIRSEWNKK